VGLGPPHRIRVPWVSRADFDPLTASGGSFDVQRPGPTYAESVWTATIEGATASGLYLVYALQSTADLDVAGEWTLIGRLNTPGGPRETRPVPMFVLPKFQR
jgi:hypothetical protein